MKKKYEEQEIVLPRVEELMVSYNYQSFNPLALLMGSHYNASTTNSFDLISKARKGIHKDNLLKLAKKLSLTIEELADILHISERTLQRYSSDTLIKTEYADKAIALAQLYEKGAEVLGSAKSFDTWLRQPNYALRNVTPLSLLDTSIGFSMVIDILGRIEYGVFS